MIHSPPKTSTHQSPRRHDIDWLRVVLFALLIWFHYAVFSLGQLEGDDSSMEIFNFPLFIIIGVMHQWRLAALFVISGMGSAFAFRRRTAKTYIVERGVRLGFPLLFATFILFFGIFEPKKALLGLFTIFPGSEDMPYGHLWFIYNLLIYSVILTPLFGHVRKNPEGFVVRAVRSILNIRFGAGIMLLPALILTLNAILFKPWGFGEVGMWWEFPRYLLYFLFGYLLISAKEDYFRVLDRIRLPISILTPILAFMWFVMSEVSSIPNIMAGGWVNEGYDAYSTTTILAASIQSFHAWFWCLLIFSWASKFLNRPSKWLAYLNEAVYPTYIVHMHLTFFPIAIFGILGVGYYSGLAIGTILVMVGVIVCFEIVRRATFARTIFGLKGGHEEVAKLYPYNRIEKKELRVVVAIGFHVLAASMTALLLALLIGAGIIGGL
tara:strand:+ start:592 stop:1902 length:1311 start_codon:yes stop_codon:yes gene_type:complete